jgi:hypothetical protein
MTGRRVTCRFKATGSTLERERPLAGYTGSATGTCSTSVPEEQLFEETTVKCIVRLLRTAIVYSTYIFPLQLSYFWTWYTYKVQVLPVQINHKTARFSEPRCQRSSHQHGEECFVLFCFISVQKSQIWDIKNQELNTSPYRVIPKGSIIRDTII